MLKSPRTPVPASEERPPFPVPSLAEIRKTYNSPYDQWPGWCGCVARAALSLMEDGEVLEGKYYGPIKEGSYFDRDYRCSADVRGPRKVPEFFIHSWVQRDRWIIDPTRWVFEDVKPYVYMRPMTGRWDKEYRAFTSPSARKRDINKLFGKRS